MSAARCRAGAGLYADFNSTVKKGEKIAKIDPSLFQASVVQAEANVTAARANVTRLQVTAEDAERQGKRASEVYEQRLISETERDNAVATARAARASVDQAKGQLAQSPRGARAGTNCVTPTSFRPPMAW
jgi:HlyD family secretion protein